MRTHHEIARCPLDGVPLLVVSYGGVVLSGCALCDYVGFYSGPRGPIAPPPSRFDWSPPTADVRPELKLTSSPWFAAVREYQMRRAGLIA